MRNNIQLYIGNERADLDNGSFLLMNYTMEELSNPTIVRNTFSRQIVLKGTPQNNKIFGGIFRNDRQTQYGSGQTGVDFDPTRKTAFRIFNESGELLEDGYLKLDKVTRTGKRIGYAVTLYGGLGSFLYGLSYDAQGNKRTMADLDFGENLDFVITRDAVAEAWARIINGYGGSAKWDIINFIPGYVGLPPSPFDANKCYVYTLSAGLEAMDGDYRAGYTIVTLNEKVTGVAAKDYRSYLQKPCIKLSALINAICDPANNGGYTVNKDAMWFDNANPYWNNVWMTLPALNDLNIDSAETTNTQTMTSVNTMLPIVGGGGAGTYKVTVNALPLANMTGLLPGNYKLWCRNTAGITMNFFVLSLTLYDSSQNPIATARYNITTDGISFANLPTPDFTFDHIDGTMGYFVDAGGNRVSFPIYAEAEGAAYYKLEMDCVNYYYGQPNANPGDMSGFMWPTGESVFANGVMFDPDVSSSQVDVVGVSSSSVRTGATITKSMLLGGGRTPADYLLSYCKMFGIQIVCHSGEKVIDLTMRRNFYTSSVVDINSRIDRSRPIEKIPFAFDARWYLFGNEAKGEFADYYQARYNRPYGQFRVNTGYEFDAEEKTMTDDIVFGNVCAVMEASPYFCELVRNGDKVPSVFLAGGTYLLYNGSETKTMNLPYLSDAAKTWDNPAYPMHDFVERLQFHGEQDAHLDERDTLVFFNGRKDVSAMSLSLTDDIERMLALNGNNPCWMPNICEVNPSWKLDDIPWFSRYYWSGDTLSNQLDWGDPLEMQIPNAEGHIGVLSNIFEGFWEKYIADRYDDDSSVVTCYVNLRGMQVGRELFRRFYAFDGCVWALNRIINHSLTTFGATQCEFVKVQDINNYLTI